MRRLVCLLVLGGCSAPCEDETAIPAGGAVRRGVFVAGSTELDVASSPAGVVARSGCDDDLYLLGDDLATTRTIGVPHSLEDMHIRHLARDAAGIAVVSYELEYIGDIDERSFTRLHVHDDDGAVRWSALLETDEISSQVEQVALGPTHVFVGERSRLTAFDRTTGAIAWSHGFNGNAIRIAAGPDGGAVAVTTFAGSLATGPGGPTLESSERRGAIAAYAGDGSVRWAMTSDVFALEELGDVAAGTGGIAVMGHEGSTSVFATQHVAMLADDGTLRWSHYLGEYYSHRVYSIVTDGTRVVAAGDFGGVLTFDPDKQQTGNDTDGFIASVGEAGVERVRVASGPSTQRAFVAALTGDSVIAYIQNYEDEGTPPRLVVGGVEIAGAGVAVVELDR